MASIEKLNFKGLILKSVQCSKWPPNIPDLEYLWNLIYSGPSMQLTGLEGQFWHRLSRTRSILFRRSSIIILHLPIMSYHHRSAASQHSFHHSMQRHVPPISISEPSVGSGLLYCASISLSVTPRCQIVVCSPVTTVHKFSQFIVGLASNLHS